MADLLNYRKEDSDMNYNINEQKLGFDRVLPWEGQVPALVKEGELKKATVLRTHLLYFNSDKSE